MFVALDDPIVGLRPSTSNITINDWNILARYWYPVAVVGNLETDKPAAGKLLDVDLVIYKSEETIVVALDVCPHRHIRLSTGTIEQDRLVCPFHGLTFNGEGRCTRVPALGRDAKLPSMYRLETFRSEVRYGLVWACLDRNSSERIPDFPPGDEVGDDHLMFGLVRDWPCSAPRQVENFTDIAHLPFVHASFGVDKEETLKPARIEQTNEGLKIEARFWENHDGRKMYKRLAWRIVMPFMIDFETSYDDDPPDMKMINFPVPISAYECRVFMVFAMDEPSPSNKSEPNPGDAINTEDMEVLKHTMRPDLPLTQKHEIHLPVDNNGLEYRRRLRDLGLGRH